MYVFVDTLHGAHFGRVHIYASNCGTCYLSSDVRVSLNIGRTISQKGKGTIFC